MENYKEKKCFKCNSVLSLSEFYIHKGMLDGHLNKCKKCCKQESIDRNNLLKKDKKWVEKENERCRDKYYRLNYSLKKQTPDQKRETIRRYRQKYPEKYLAIKYTEIFLIKQNGINVHHWSYNQKDWLDIIELTIKDHNLLHRFLYYDQDIMLYKDKDGNILDKKEKHLELLEKIKKNYEN